MHPATERIYQAAQALVRLEERPKPSQVAAEVNISQQVLKHLEHRGPSNVGLLEWQLARGVNASWVITGRGPMFIGNAPGTPLSAKEPAADWEPWPLSAELLHALQQLDAAGLRRIENSVRSLLDLPPLQADPKHRRG